VSRILHANYVRTRWRTIPFSLTFTVLEVRNGDVLVWAEAEGRERTIPRGVFERALRQRALVYLGLARRRRSA